MHKIEASCNRLNSEISFSRLLAEGVFVCNAFSFYNGVSPYNALFGRQPNCLPDLQNIDFDDKGTDTDGQREHRIRISALEAITQATCENKIKTALNAKTTPDGTHLYHPGEEVDYYRKPSHKDDTDSWHGPFTVVRNIPDEGQAIIRIGTQEIPVSYQDLHHTLYTAVLALSTTQLSLIHI